MPRSPTLTSSQLALVAKAAATLPISDRPDFERRVLARLGGGTPASDAVQVAINLAMPAAPVGEV